MSEDVGYVVKWLRPQHAAAAARLEAGVHPAHYRAGQSGIHEQLEEAEIEGSNLSLGLFYHGRLVGYLLAFREAYRENICQYIDVSQPSGVELSGPGIYIADFLSASKHRGAAWRLLMRFASYLRVRADTRDLPIEAFCTDPWLSTWCQRRKMYERLGVRMIRSAEFLDRHRQRLHWLQFAQATTVQSSDFQPLRSHLRAPTTLNAHGGPLTVGVIDTLAGWEALAPHWNPLLDQSPHATVFQTYEYLRAWWDHLRTAARPFIVVALVEELPVAIAPMQIVQSRWLGGTLRCLTFMGAPAEVDRPAVLMRDCEIEIAEALVEYLCDTGGCGAGQVWDCAVLYEQHSQSVFLQLFAARLRLRRDLVSFTAGPECPRIGIQGTWADYLASRGRDLRKGLKRKQRMLSEQGEVGSDHGEDAAPQTALDRYVELEERSWKPQAGLGVAKSSAHLAFYRNLAARFGERGLQFTFLTLNDRTIAATFGLRWRDRFYSLHIAHDTEFSRFSPGLLLTAAELQRAFEQRQYVEYDLLGGFLTNKSSWATQIHPSVAFYVDRPTWRGRLFHLYFFGVKPLTKRVLQRWGLFDRALQLKSTVHAHLAGPKSHE